MFWKSAKANRDVHLAGKRAAGRGLSIRGKVLLAFLVLSAITGAVGTYAILSLTQSGKLVAQTYDRPLMSISFARQVLADFSRLEAAFSRRLLAQEADDIQVLDKERADRASELNDDLDVAERRSSSERARKAVSLVRNAVADWVREGASALSQKGVPDWTGLNKASATVNEQIDLLVNYAAGDGFVARQEALAAIESNRQVQIGGTVAALILSLVVAMLLIRRIIGPVAQASQAANRIAQGELDVSIPVTGRDELASLLDAMGVMRDNIRAMMNKEIALRRSAQIRLVDAIESSSEGVIVVDGDGKIVVANTQVARIFAAVGDQVVRGNDFHAMVSEAVEQGVFAAGTAKKRRALIERLEATDESGALEEQLADGRWLRISRNRTGDGGYVAIYSDITLQKEREAMLRDAKDRAEAANRTKSEFLAAMGHELRTPLNAVIGFSELMESEVMGPLGQPKYKEFMGDVLGSARRLLNIINDILEWSKIEAGHAALNVEPVDLREIFEDVRRLNDEVFEQAGVSLRVRIPSEEMSINADRPKLMLILMNLLSNAAKFTPKGGKATLSARTDNEGFVEVTVTDTGIGMRDEDIPKALAPFGQIDSSLARKFEGTGLGLALVKVFVERHGGAMQIATEPGKGTAVTISLPAICDLRLRSSQTALQAAG